MPPEACSYENPLQSQALQYRSNSTIGTTKLFPANNTQLVMTPKTLGHISWLTAVGSGR